MDVRAAAAADTGRGGGCRPIARGRRRCRCRSSTALAAATGQTPQRGAVVLQRRRIQMIVAVLIWILIVAALARPQWVGDAVTREVSARDLILAIDISGSMEQADFRTAAVQR